jgi:hypothetical protein
VQWREPEPIPSGLLPVAAFEPYFLPESIRPWVMDVADRMQCPADYIGITAICVLGSTLGRKIKVRPKQHDDWSVTANFWAAIVGNPGGKKSPSIEQVLKPTLRRFEALANKNFADAKTDFDNKMRVFKLMDDEAEKKARKSKIGLRQAYEAERPMDKPEPPVQARYLTSESTYEKLALIMKDNPNGVTLHRDELISLFRNLDQEEQCNARAFHMTAWNGDDAVTIDRVIRGTDYVEHACLSINGSTQPDKLVPYVRDIHKGKGGGDGFLQRFNLLCWPDRLTERRFVDERGDTGARCDAFAVYDHLHKLCAEGVNAEFDRFDDKLAFLRFEPAAQAVFNKWYEANDHLLDSDISPALEGHFAKYPKLVPGLALVFHLADDGKGSISETAICRAVALARYLETHARRAYASGVGGDATAARSILTHIRRGDLKDGFTARDVLRPCWTNLSGIGDVKAGLEMLCELAWISGGAVQPGPLGGRPSLTYWINPKAK